MFRHEFIFALAVLLPAAGYTQESNWFSASLKWLGTWSLNLEKSNLQDMLALGPGTTVTAQTLTIEEAAGKLKLKGSTILSNGRPSPDEINVLDLEGKVTTVSPGITVSFKRISEVSFDILVQVNTGTINASGLNRFVISLDGKTLTESKTQVSREVVPEGADPTQGRVLKSSTSVFVFDKLR